MVAPWVAWMTIWSPSPDAAGKFLVSRLTAAWESVLGRLKLELKWLPSPWLSPSMVTTASSHPATTVLRWWKHQRANRVMRRTSGGSTANANDGAVASAFNDRGFRGGCRRPTGSTSAAPVGVSASLLRTGVHLEVVGQNHPGGVRLGGTFRTTVGGMDDGGLVAGDGDPDLPLVYRLARYHYTPGPAGADGRGGRRPTERLLLVRAAPDGDGVRGRLGRRPVGRRTR